LLVVAVVLAIVALSAVGVKVVAQSHATPALGPTVNPSVQDSEPAPSTPAASAATDTSPPPLSTPADKVPAKKPAVKPSPKARPTPLRPNASVAVLNNSTVPRLAARVAAHVRADGFRVIDVGNLTGRTESTTVYYSAGYLAQANLLAIDLPGRQRVLPRYAGLPSHAALTVVVTEDFLD
jgi:hypothetical protein